MNNLTFGNARHQYYETICGGSGAGRDFDGTSAVHTHMTNSRLTDPEVLEDRYPVLLEEFSIRAGSGGAGAHKGGDGTLRRIRLLEPMTAAFLSMRRETAPFGLAGGGDGAIGENSIVRADGRTERLKAATKSNFTRAIRSSSPRPAAEGMGRHDQPPPPSQTLPRVERRHHARTLERSRPRRAHRGNRARRHFGRCGNRRSDPAAPCCPG